MMTTILTKALILKMIVNLKIINLAINILAMVKWIAV